MKTIREWLEELPEPYRSQALENFDNYWTKEEQDDLSKRISLSFAVLSAFAWDESKQGGDYWNKLYDTL